MWAALRTAHTYTIFKKLTESMKLAFIIDPIAKLDPAHDTSVALMEAACRKGHEVFITNMNTLTFDLSNTLIVSSVKINNVSLSGSKSPSSHFRVK